MEPGIVFHQMDGFGHHGPRPHHEFHPRQATNGDEHEEHANPHRIAHTLTACCRCRQRKTRCDPTLPRCVPCERSGSICEYYDTTRGKKISRNYVVKLQERVRALDAELGQYIDEDDDLRANDHEHLFRPGGLVKLNETDETPRYLGPSSGIAMTRVVMEEAKRYTDSGRISELIPNIKYRRKATGSVAMAPGNRSQSFSMPPAAKHRKKSYPMISGVAAAGLQSRTIADKLVESFLEKGQMLTPAIHERTLTRALDDVYEGSQDPYHNFVVRLVMAISLQKINSTYAGLADSYYLAAMQYFEAVVRPKDLKTLQCLILIGQYSLLTPTRTAVYYIIGLATRISQQLGLADEKTITLGDPNPLDLDMRRRLGWIVSTLELGLSHSMGRPNGFAKTDDIVDIRWFESVPDANITETGIIPGPPDEKKLVAIHFCKMRLLQAEIRRTLYEMKRSEPRNAQHPWFTAMEEKMKQWLWSSPEKPVGCKSWFTGRYHTMIITLHRPSPQVPRPSAESAVKCFDSAASVIDISSKQMMLGAVDITWVFVLTLYMSLNTLLWCVTRYPDVRAVRSRDDVEERVNIALDIITQCVERWPGTASASELYAILSRACLQSYDADGTPSLSTPGSLNTPPPSQPQSGASPVRGVDVSGNIKTEAPSFNPPQFGQVFGSAAEPVVDVDTDSYNLGLGGNGAAFPFPGHPTFRSNSIFLNPASNDHTGRRFSYFPPDFMQTDMFGASSGSGSGFIVDASPPASESATISPPFLSSPQLAQTPPEPLASLGAAAGATPSMSTPMLSTPLLATAAPQGSPDAQLLSNTLSQTPQQQRPPLQSFVPPVPHGQRPLPQAIEWGVPLAPFMSPYAFGNGMMGGNSNSNGAFFWSPHLGPGGFDGLDVAGVGGAMDAGLPPGRQGSLSQAQQIELMDELETEGIADIDSYLNSQSMAYALGGGLDVDMSLGWPAQP
ncbi:hypothetical protein F4777DRAFT_552307 [Nemania sp. FL0916]|nr:hypothetical protein F4777DRAFT_552307 [Nemania sp. FL0916]